MALLKRIIDSFNYPPVPKFRIQRKTISIMGYSGFVLGVRPTGEPFEADSSKNAAEEIYNFLGKLPIGIYEPLERKVAGNLTAGNRSQEELKRIARPGIDYPGVSVVFFCHDGKGNHLMNFRSENCRDEKNRWDIGGGSVENGEGITDTLKKEIKEEYCTEVISSEFLGYRDIHRVEDGTKTHWITLDFKVLVDREKAGNGEPHKFNDAGWFTIGNLPSPTHSQFPAFLEKYMERLKS